MALGTKLGIIASSGVASFTNTYSLDFDGVDDYVETSGVYSELDGQTKMTFSAWIKPTSATTSVIASVEDSGSTEQFRVVFHGSRYILIRTHTGGGRDTRTANASITLNVWTHIAFCLDFALSSGTRGKIFINGVDATSADAMNQASLNTSGGGLRIGARNVGTLLPFPGLIDEVAIWSGTDQRANISDIYSVDGAVDLSLLSTPPTNWFRMGDNGAYKSPQFLLPNNENKDKVSNYSFDFDGVDGLVDCGTSIGTSFGENYTGAIAISVWFKADLTSGDDGIFQFTGSTSLGEISVAVYAGDLEIRIKGSLEASGTFTDTSNWHHLLINLISPSGANQVYLDGATFDSTFTYSGGGLDLDGEDFYIGYYGGSRYWNGKIDELSIFNTDQTSNVAALYNNGKPTTLPSGAVAHYKMGEEANFTSNWLVDNSALTNYSKMSFQLDGVDDYIDCGSSSYLLNTTQFSFSLWAKQTTATSTKGIFGDWAYNSRGNFILQTLTVSGNSTKLQFGIRESSGFKLVDTDDYVFTENIWNHIAIIFNAGSLNIYVNGVNKTFTGDVLPTSLVNSLGTLVIGKFAGLGRHFNGLIDEVAIFDSAISIGDVWDGSGQPIDVSAVSGIVSNYRMGEDASFNGTNWTVPDNVGTNTGTSANMTVDDLVGEAPNYSGGGISSGMTIEDRVGTAPSSSNNALSFNMVREDRVEDVPS